jgi:hypothetical protein
MRSSLKLGLALAVLSIGTTTQVQAQTSGQIQATVNVLTALSMTPTNLQFGNIAPTQTKTVDVTSANAGRFQINGAPGASVSFSFTSLPANFGATSNITLGSWTGYSNSTASASAGGTSFTPTSSYSESVTLNGTGNHYFYVGATLNAAGAPTGTHNATIAASVVYN